jgi:hypothetical protein
MHLPVGSVSCSSESFGSALGLQQQQQQSPQPRQQHQEQNHHQQQQSSQQQSSQQQSHDSLVPIHHQHQQGRYQQQQQQSYQQLQAAQEATESGTAEIAGEMSEAAAVGELWWTERLVGEAQAEHPGELVRTGRFTWIL